jgi:ATP:ADP antiporter, AAA family
MNIIEISPRTVNMMGKTVSETFSIPLHDMPRVIYHGIVLSVIISGFWLLDSLKDPILSSTVGIEYQPIAKFCSVFATLLVVCIYDFLTTITTKPILFHLISWVYGVAFMTISAILSDPVHGLSQSKHDPSRLIGWIAYFVVESYGSLMVTMFWSFTNSVMDLEEAKGAYGLIIAIAQVGAILGSTIATNAHIFGVPQLFIIGSMTVLSVSLLMKVYGIIYKSMPSVQEMSTHVDSADDDESEKPAVDTDISILHRFIEFFKNFYSGFMIIIRYPYTLKILAISCLYEVVITVMDYQFKILGAFHSSETVLPPSSMSQFDSLFVDETAYANLLGRFGQLTNAMSLLISIFGFSYTVHRIGVKYSLMIFPSTLFFVVILTNLYPTLPVLFICVSVMKALIFALHDPVKELLYNPTSHAVKFRAKAWIDVFGSRSAKALGSFMTNMGGSNIRRLKHISEIPCLILSVAILAIAWSAGEEFQELVSSGKVIGKKGVQPMSAEDPYKHLPVRNGLKPGDVGYDGYDLQLFDGVFDDEAAPESTASVKIRRK